MVSAFPDRYCHATVFVGQIRLAEDVLNLPTAVGAFHVAKDTYTAVPDLCLYRFEYLGPLARGTVSQLGLPRAAAEQFVHDFVLSSRFSLRARFFLSARFSVGERFSPGVRLICLVLVSRQQRCWSSH